METHSNILAWKIPWTEELGGLQSTGLQKSRTQLSNQIRTAKCTSVMSDSSVTPWTVAHQAPLSMEFPRQE